MMKKVIIKTKAEEKFRRKNLWFYENEIKKYPKEITPGEIVEIFSSSGRFLGTGYFNPKSKIPLRVLTFHKKEDIKKLIEERIKTSAEKRNNLKKITDAFRIIHSEADLLPGVIADYYSGYISLQINTAGMEKMRNTVIKSIIKILSPEGIYDKSDKKVRKIEGLETENKTIYKTVPEEIIITENNIKFCVNIKESQKTGFYLDQRANRQIVSNYVKKGFKVLDLFSNSGGFGIYAVVKGADFVKFVDISQKVSSQIRKNCDLNNVKSYEIVEKDVFKHIKNERGKDYDLIILDPPSFAKTKKEKEGALRGLKYLILNSFKALKKGGYLVVFSCSFHISIEDLWKVSLQAAGDTGVMAHILEFMYQDKDHPVLLNMENTLYLKGLLIKKG